jgi:cytoskeletal protein RodZ
LSFDQVHSQLRITPAILESLERADFYHMPLKGHARNMVSSYARFLGLDPNELTKQFLKEYHDFENHMARQNGAQAPFSGYKTGAGSSTSIESRPSTSQRPSGAASSQ